MTDALSTDDPSGNKKWVLTQEAFDKFLFSLESDRDRAGEKYEQIRAGLVRFFEWRGCSLSEHRADETINRVARKLEQGEQFRDICTYVYGVARMLALEVARESSRELAALDDLPGNQTTQQESDELQAAVECLRRCQQKLTPENREMISAYYQGENRARIENRKRLAEKLAVPLNALRIRACRLREKLQICVERCLNYTK